MLTDHRIGDKITFNNGQIQRGIISGIERDGLIRVTDFDRNPLALIYPPDVLCRIEE